MSIKVLVVDDSALMRALLTKIINNAPDLSVVGSAPNPIVAREMIKELNPDVLTLDVDMPQMDGLDFLGRLMCLRPMPVIMISSFTDQGSGTTLQALKLGAVDCIAKPATQNISALTNYFEDICEKIRTANNTHLKVTPPCAHSHAYSIETGHPVQSKLDSRSVATRGVFFTPDLQV